MANDLPLGEQVGDGAGALLGREGAVGVAVRVEEGPDLAVRVARAPVRAALGGAPARRHRARALEVGVVGVERGAESAAGVARGGLDPQVLEGALAQEAAV